MKLIQNKNDEDFEDYIETKKNDIVSYHLKQNSFYKTFAKHANPFDWNNIPIMTKQDLQHPLLSLLSDGFSKHNIYIDKTSGASGTPFIFQKTSFVMP